MELHIQTPRKALNKAYLKMKPLRSAVTVFKNNLIQLLDDMNEAESEEFHKNLVSKFLDNTYYAGQHFINTKGRNDLVIHNGKDAKSSVGVIVEAKKPSNKWEMMHTNNINQKAMHELVLYFLRERITHKNLDLKNLIATNIHEWFVFDAHLFEKHFAQNKTLLKQFADFEEGRMGGKSTDFFYKEIAAPAVAEVANEMVFTHFDLRDYDKPLRNADVADDNKLIALFKVFSPEHLLKLPFANDSNSLNKAFYSELLHIIGLTETKDGGKKLITRKSQGQRDAGSLLENAIAQIDVLDKLNRVDKPSKYGIDLQERLFNLGLELCITWVNRILFLKLLEAQLINYHKGDKQYAFLTIEKIGSYDELNLLFFSVLARTPKDRIDDEKVRFAKVPYLNSSLFEPTEIEHQTLFISNLRDDHKLALMSHSVIRKSEQYKKATDLNALEYLFEFLNAYDFSSEGGGEIQEDNKNLINASVLGLIFEKINGYRDGSFFTPGFITMYMARETIRRAVVQKFNDAKSWNCSNLEELYDKIEDRKEANQIVNSLKICDPAVGSGHFLVSALNELIAIKSDLKILTDRDDRRLKEYHVEVVNDELILTDEDGDLFEYRPSNKESQRVQETLFHEKQTLIENCLFGVDINPNSVKICRLRLWIELLKNAYYKNETELETLPNIDINIKCGNSLISRYALDADIKQALKKSKWNIESYRLAVSTYQNASSKEEKHEMERLIGQIKGDFVSEIAINDKRLIKLNRLKGELMALTGEVAMFERSAKQKADWNKEVEKRTKEITSIKAELEEIKNNKIYDNALEWRFEFPEVLNDDGDFVGFDVVIGNPPYIRQEEFSDIKPFLQNNFATYAGTADLYVYFVERGLQIAKQNGNFIYILPNKWMRAGYGNALRKWILNFDINFIHDFGDLPVFEEATTYPCLWQITKQQASESNFTSSNIQTLDFSSGMKDYIDSVSFVVNQNMLSEKGWTLVNDKKQLLLEKIKNAAVPLSKYVNGKIFYGIKTGLNEAFVINEDTKNKLIAEDVRNTEIIKPFLAGRDIKRYQQPKNNKYLIFTRRGIIIENYPAILEHLYQFREQLEPKPANYSGTEWKGRKPGSYKWYEIQDAVDYYEEFDKPKVMLPDISLRCEAQFDTKGFYCVNTAYLIPELNFSDLGILNSSLVLFFYANLTQTIRGGYFRFIRQYLEQIPMIKTNILDNLVQEIISAKSLNPTADTTALEAEIDRLVYELYGLSEEEIGIVEGVRLGCLCDK